MRKKKVFRSKKKDIVVILHNIRSLHNIGSLFRTSDAAGVSKIFLTGYTASPDNQKSAKVALGAEKNVPWERISRLSMLIQQLRKEGYQIAALEQNTASIPYEKFHPLFPLALVVGNEVSGISPKTLRNADVIIEIPMQGKKESLNVSVAFGIAIYKILERLDKTIQRS